MQAHFAITTNLLSTLSHVMYAHALCSMCYVHACTNIIDVMLILQILLPANMA